MIEFCLTEARAADVYDRIHPERRLADLPASSALTLPIQFTPINANVLKAIAQLCR